MQEHADCTASSSFVCGDWERVGDGVVELRCIRGDLSAVLLLVLHSCVVHL